MTREHKIRKVGGLYGLYLHYCYKLGYLPKYQKQNPARLHYLLREDLMKLDQITAQVMLRISLSVELTPLFTRAHINLTKPDGKA